MTGLYHRFTLLISSFTEHYIKTFLIALLAGIAIILASCEGNPTVIGGELLPPSDFVSVFSDTMSVKAYTMYSDSIPSGNPSTSYLGTLYDPYFGTDTAEFVSQMRLVSNWPKGFAGVDSIRLHLHLLSVTGNVSQPLRLKMSEIAKEIFVDSTYYSSQKVPLTGYSITCDLPSGLRADTINDITIKVSPDFGEYVARDTSMLFHSNTIPDFRSYFRGIYFQLIAQEPVMISLSVEPATDGYAYSNYFNFYMHDKNGAALTPFTFAFDAVSRNAAFNRYIHDFDAAVPGKKIKHINDTNVLDTISYVQKMNGVYTRLVIPGLEDIKNGPDRARISVNKARIIIPVYYDYSLYKPSTIPQQAYMRYLTGTGSKSIVPDYFVSSVSTDFYGGTPDTLANVNVYKFNIPTFVQVYLDDKNNVLKPEVEIFLPSASSHNAILKANNSHPRIKFEFTYTKF